MAHDARRERGPPPFLHFESDQSTLITRQATITVAMESKALGQESLSNITIQTCINIADPELFTCQIILG